MVCVCVCALPHTVYVVCVCALSAHSLCYVHGCSGRTQSVLCVNYFLMIRKVLLGTIYLIQVAEWLLNVGGGEFIEIFQKRKIMKVDATATVKFRLIHSMQYSSVQHIQSNVNEWNDGN